MWRRDSKAVCALIVVGILLFAVPLTWTLTGTARADDTVTLHGTVNDNGGSPIAGAEVSAIDAVTQEVEQSVVTNGGGEYAMSIPPGTYDVKVIPPVESGFGTATASGQIITADKVLDFVLVPSSLASLSGRVLDPLGNGVPGQRVSLAPAGTENYTFYNITDSSGCYFLDLIPGEYDLRVSCSDNTPDINMPRYYNVYSEEPLSIYENIVMEIALPLKRVDVHVQDGAGEPLPDVLITNDSIYQYGVAMGNLSILGVSRYSDLNNPPATDSSGNATLWLFPTNTGPYVLTAIPPAESGLPIKNVFDFAFTGDTSISIEIAPPVFLSGGLLHPLGNGAPDQRISLRQLGTGSFNITGVTDSSGCYSLGVSPGEYNLRVANGNNTQDSGLPTYYSVESDEPLSIHEDVVMDMALPLKRVDVHVRNQAGEPVPGVRITNNWIRQNDLAIGTLPARGYSQYNNLYTAVSTDTSGNATLWLFPTTTGPYVLTATPPTGSGLATTSITDVSFTEDTSVDIEIGPPVVLSGRVLDSIGNGLPDQRVSLAPAGTGDFTIIGFTDSSGGYSLEFSPGEYDLRLNGTNYDFSLNIPKYYNLYGEEPLSIHEDVVMDMALPSKSVSVHVQDQAGMPVPGVRINSNTVSQYGLTSNTVPFSGLSTYNDIDITVSTDSSGDTTLWLFPTSTQPYDLTATPPLESPYTTFYVYDVTFTSDMSVVIALQFVHDPPVTTSSLDPEPDEQGVCTGPVTVTLSAAAAEGFSIESTFYSIDGGEELIYMEPFEVSGAGTHTVEYRSIDNAGVYESPKTLELEILSNQAPVADAGDDQVLEATCAQGAEATLDGSGSSDPDEDELEYAWTGGFGTLTGMSPSVMLPLGGNSISLTVSDGFLESTDEVSVDVVDTTPPQLIVPDDVTITATGETTPVSLPEAAANDLVDGDVPVSNNALSAYPLGTTTVIFTAVDSHGNNATETTSVTVTDENLPVVSVSGISDGESYTDGATAVVEISDGESGVKSQSVTLDEALYVSGTEIAGKGEHTLVATAADYADNITTVTVSFTIYDSTFMTLTATPCQYSDMSTFCATLTTGTGAVSGEEISFLVDGTGAGTAVTEENGTAVLDSVVSLQSGVYPASAQFAQDNARYLRASEDTAQLDVAKETAEISYSGNYLKMIDESFVLSAEIEEEADGTPGSIEMAGGVVFEVLDPQGNVVREVSADIVEEAPGSGTAAVDTDPLPANVYTIRTCLADNQYYQAADTSNQFVVYNPSGGFATGGGFICDCCHLKTFGFCVKPSCVEPWLPKGNFVFVDHSCIFNPLVIKSTDFTWLVIPEGGDTAYVAGTCCFDWAPGYYFYLTVQDLNKIPYCGSDTIYLKVTDADDNTVYEVQGDIDGGNIKIHE